MNETQFTPDDFADVCGECFERLTQLNKGSESTAVDRTRSSEPGLAAECSVCQQAAQRWSPVLKHLQLADQQLHAATASLRPMRGAAPWLTGEPIERIASPTLPPAVEVDGPGLPTAAMSTRDTSRRGFWLSSSLVALAGIALLVGVVFVAGRWAESRLTRRTSVSAIAIAELLKQRPTAEGVPSEAGINRLVSLGLPGDCRPGLQPTKVDLAGDDSAAHEATAMLINQGFVCCTQCHRSLPANPALEVESSSISPATLNASANARGAQVAKNCAVCHVVSSPSECLRGAGLHDAGLHDATSSSTLGSTQPSSSGRRPESSLSESTPSDLKVADCKACHQSVSAVVPARRGRDRAVSPSRFHGSTLLACSLPTFSL